MAGGKKAPKPSKRQHFIARFYLRNFADPMFSDNLCVYDMRKRRWEKRTPEGVGWFPHLCSMIDAQGKRTDAFDRFLKLKVEDPAAPAMKKVAIGGKPTPRERRAIAMFIALTAARSPNLMRTVTTDHVEGLGEQDRAELDGLVQIWCEKTGRPHDSKAVAEFLKPNALGAIWTWSRYFRAQLLEWEWRLIRTPRARPFITTDRPVLAQREDHLRFVSFPVSSEFALIMFTGGSFNVARDRAREAHAMNRGTMDRATEFVVACQQSFPGDEFLVERAARS